MIEASEMFVLEGRDDQVGQCDRAGLYSIAGELPALKKNFRKDIERVLDAADDTFLEAALIPLLVGEYAASPLFFDSFGHPVVAIVHSNSTSARRPSRSW
jgi:hypothetical protein